MGVLRAGLGTLLLVFATACSEPFVPPTTASECVESARGIKGAGSEDVSSGWSVAYSHESHPLGASGEVYLCMDDEFETTVSVDPHPGTAVDPNPLNAPTGSDGVEELVVTVSAADAEPLAVEFDSGGALGATIVIEVEVDGDEWSFGRNYGG
jgi:hypothetical protein